nr:DUF6578 domain-containing protein [Streptomyces sp. DH12]
MGGECARGIDFREEHHGREQAPTWLRVLAIVEVHCRYEVPPGGSGDGYRPVPGTTVLVPAARRRQVGQGPTARLGQGPAESPTARVGRVRRRMAVGCVGRREGVAGAAVSHGGCCSGCGPGSGSPW